MEGAQLPPRHTASSRRLQCRSCCFLGLGSLVIGNESLQLPEPSEISSFLLETLVDCSSALLRIHAGSESVPGELAVLTRKDCSCSP